MSETTDPQPTACKPFDIAQPDFEQFMKLPERERQDWLLKASTTAGIADRIALKQHLLTVIAVKSIGNCITPRAVPLQELSRMYSLTVQRLRVQLLDVIRELNLEGSIKLIMGRNDAKLMVPRSIWAYACQCDTGFDAEKQPDIARVEYNLMTAEKRIAYQPETPQNDTHKW